jgi:hypothetical protein
VIPNMSGNIYRASNTNNTSSGPQGTSTSYRDLGCYVCHDSNHRMINCPKFKEYINRGWLIPESPNSSRYKLRDNMRMPKFDPNEPRYLKIEALARERGWDGLEAYFANLEEDVLEVSIVSSPDNQISVFLRKIDELTSRLSAMESDKEEEQVFNRGTASLNGKN